MKTSPEVQNLIRSSWGETSDYAKENGFQKVLEPTPRSIVYMIDDSGQFKPIKIISGCFLDPTFGRVSNYWYWREFDESGNIIETECSGYGGFYKKIK